MTPKPLTREELLKLPAKVTFFPGHDCFLETEQGNFVWSDPEYGGDNTLRPHTGLLSDFIERIKPAVIGMALGKKSIQDCCGDRVVLEVALAR